MVGLAAPLAGTAAVVVARGGAYLAVLRCESVSFVALTYTR